MIGRAATAVPALRVSTVEREWVLTLAYGVAVTVLAAAVRLIAIGDLPYGLHGDEALTGLDAQRILAEGWIGPYVYPSGLGQPAGPLYWVAFVFSQFGASMATLRAAIAVFGILTVALTYGLASTWFDRPTAVIAAFLLAVMPWHFHLSRTGYMVASWPVITLATCWALSSALRPHAPAWRSLAAGVIAGFGVYTYNAYPISFALYAVCFILAAMRDGQWWRTVSRWFGFMGAAVAAASPLIAWALEHPVEYLTRAHGLALFNSEDWLAAPSWAARGWLFLHEVDHYVVGLTSGGRPDFADGLSGVGFPPVNPVVILCAVVGLIMWRREWRRWPVGILFAAVLIFPWGAFLTIGNGDYRRTLALAPFLAMLAALPLAQIWRSQQPLGAAILAAGLTLVGAFDLARYPASMQTPEAEHVFAPELRMAADYINSLPPGIQVNFFSDRWSVHYETLRFLAGDLDGARNASREFRSVGEHSAWGGVTTPAVAVFLGRYLDWADKAKARWPGGYARDGIRGDQVRMKIYQLP
jgi:4-amino-4-deoxy-L-arabinose transferase-like glycosyltransferase